MLTRELRLSDGAAFLPVPPLAPHTRSQRRVSRVPATCSTATDDAAMMRRSLEVARRAAGQTRPNPAVGCVLVGAGGAVIGEGWTQRAGGDHAEVRALKMASANGAQTAGCCAYVTLEPCDHFGKTPPCSGALVRAGVRRVVVGVVDPDPRVSGGGLKTLQSAGVEVVVGVEERLCRDSHEGFMRRVRAKSPFGVLKYAMTLDGKIATESGRSKWVTGPASRQRVHAIRSAVDAIVVGGQTVRMDDPRLTVRNHDDQLADPSGELLAPIRVVMTRDMDLPLEARLWNDAERIETVVLTAPGHGKVSLVQELRARGVVVEEVPGLRPRDAMSFLYERDCLNVLWECGGALSASAISDGAVQKVHAFVAPKIIGGASAPSPVASPSVSSEMGHALRLERQTVEKFDNGDILVSGYLPEL